MENGLKTKFILVQNKFEIRGYESCSKSSQEIGIMKEYVWILTCFWAKINSTIFMNFWSYPPVLCN